MTNVSLGGALAVALISVALCACSPVTLVNALTPRTTYREVTNLAYGTFERQRLDVYVPTHPDAGASGMPVVVFFYGGSWQNGQRGDYRFVGEALASRGFLVVVPDYRTYPEVTFPGFMDDAAIAVRWASDRARAFGGDPERLFLMGHSAGAQMVALLATDARYLHANGMRECDIAGVIGLAGPYDFLPLKSDVLRRIFPEPVRLASQPIHFVTGREPPMWLAVGDADTVVDPGNTTRFARRLQRMNDEVEVRHYDLGHAMLLGTLSAPLRGYAPVLDDIASFVNSAPERASVHPACS